MAKPAFFNILSNRTIMNRFKGNFQFCGPHAGNFSKMLERKVTVKVILNIVGDIRYHKLVFRTDKGLMKFFLLTVIYDRLIASATFAS